MLKTHYSFLKIETCATNSTAMFVVCAAASYWTEIRLGAGDLHSTSSLEKLLDFAGLIFLLISTVSGFLILL
jgi:hypothetical protein